MHHNSHQFVFLAGPILWEEWSDHFDGQNAAPLGSKTLICGSHTIKCCTWYRVSFINSICQVAILKWIWTSIMNLSQKNLPHHFNRLLFCQRALVSLLSTMTWPASDSQAEDGVAAGKWVNVMTLRIPKKTTTQPPLERGKLGMTSRLRVSWNMWSKQNASVEVITLPPKKSWFGEKWVYRY